MRRPDIGGGDRTSMPPIANRRAAGAAFVNHVASRPAGVVE